MMKNLFRKSLLIFLAVPGFCLAGRAQQITYSSPEKADYKNIDFEILGKFDTNFLVYKNLNKRHELSIYDNSMQIKNKVRFDFVSDKTETIDFVTYPDRFLMVWNYERNGISWFKGANISADGTVIGSVRDLDSTRFGFLGTKTTYDFSFSENRKFILLYKMHYRDDNYFLMTKIYDDSFQLLDSSRHVLEYNNRRDDFGDIQIGNDGTIVFSKTGHNARPEYIFRADLYFKKLKEDTLISVKIPLNDDLIQDPAIKIDNLNNRYLVNSFSYAKKNGNVNGIFTSIVGKETYEIVLQTINRFSDTLVGKLSGRPDWRTAFNNFYFRNIILKKDGGFIAVTEEYYRQRRFNNTAFDPFYGPGFGSWRYYGSASDYYFFNRGYGGFYRPYDNYGYRDVIYNYDDVIAFSFDKDIHLQWNNVINKSTSDLDTDNFLSFFNLNAGGELHFIFLQKENRQIMSNFGIRPDGTLTRYPTLRSREAGFSFMPRLARQTGNKEMIIPCLFRNNIAFAKIEL